MERDEMEQATVNDFRQAAVDDFWDGATDAELGRWLERLPARMKADGVWTSDTVTEILGVAARRLKGRDLTNTKET